MRAPWDTSDPGGHTAGFPCWRHSTGVESQALCEIYRVMWGGPGKGAGCRSLYSGLWVLLGLMERHYYMVAPFSREKNAFRIWDCPSFLILSLPERGRCSLLLKWWSAFSNGAIQDQRPSQAGGASKGSQASHRLQNSPQGPRHDFSCLRMCTALPENWEVLYLPRKSGRTPPCRKVFCRESLTLCIDFFSPPLFIYNVDILLYVVLFFTLYIFS